MRGQTASCRGGHCPQGLRSHPTRGSSPGCLVPAPRASSQLGWAETLALLPRAPPQEGSKESPGRLLRALAVRAQPLGWRAGPQAVEDQDSGHPDPGEC